MKSQNFKDMDLTGRDFSGQDLSYSLFRGANLTDCNFTGCRLWGINFRFAIIENTNFTDAEMWFANPEGTTGTAIWTNAKVAGMPRSLFTAPDADKLTLSLDQAFTDMVYAVIDAVPDMDLSLITPSDIAILRQWKTGMGNIGKLTGSYEIVEHGHHLYETLGGVPKDTMENILNMCMKQNVSFNKHMQLFYK